MRVQTRDGHELAVRIQGDGTLAVIFIHGWMVSGAVWDDMLPFLPPRRHRFILPDRRGAGGSDRPADGHGIAQAVDDIMSVADAADVQRFAVVGHSMGGQIAQVLAARHPERVVGAVLLSPVPTSGIPFPPDAAGLFSTCAGDREKQIAVLGAACKSLPDDARERILAHSLLTSEEAIQQGFEAFKTGGFADELNKITAPVLCVATDDPFLPVPFLQQNVVDPIARATLVHLPGPGHYLPNETPRETAALVGAFLAAL